MRARGGRFLRGLERELRHGIATVRILEILAEGPTYGYALLQRLRVDPEGPGAIGPAVLYPTLARLSVHGLVRVFHGHESLGPIRKYYELTTEGRQALPIVRDLFRDLRGDRPPPPDGSSLSVPPNRSWPDSRRLARPVRGST